MHDTCQSGAVCLSSIHDVYWHPVHAVYWHTVHIHHLLAPCICPSTPLRTPSIHVRLLAHCMCPSSCIDNKIQFSCRQVLDFIWIKAFAFFFSERVLFFLSHFVNPPILYFPSFSMSHLLLLLYFLIFISILFPLHFCSFSLFSHKQVMKVNFYFYSKVVKIFLQCMTDAQTICTHHKARPNTS